MFGFCSFIKLSICNVLIVPFFKQDAKLCLHYQESVDGGIFGLPHIISETMTHNNAANHVQLKEKIKHNTWPLRLFHWVISLFYLHFVIKHRRKVNRHFLVIVTTYSLV